MQEEDLGELLASAALDQHHGVVFAGDVNPRRTPAYAEDGPIERLAPQNRLCVMYVGSLCVVSRAPFPGNVVCASSDDRVYAAAWRAPARGWFDLLFRVTGRHVEHGDAPISLDAEATPDELEAATVLTSGMRVRRRRVLEDLPPAHVAPSGRVVSLELQAILWFRGQHVALVSGRIVAPGDELARSFRIISIYERYVTFSDWFPGRWDGSTTFAIGPP